MLGRARLAAGLLAIGTLLVPVAGCGQPPAPLAPTDPASIASTGTAAASAASPSASNPSAPNSTSPDARLRFVIASDGHLGDTKAEDSEQDLAELVSALNAADAAEPLDFVLLNGDLADRGVASAQKAKALLAGLAMPQFFLQGNHDRLSADEWRAVWGTPANQVLNRGPYSLILANTSNQAGDELCADEGWLATALRGTSGQRAVLVAMHVPPKTWTKYGVDCAGVRKLLADAGNVRAVFLGHDHDQLGMRMSLGVRYFFDGHFGGHWGNEQKTLREVELSDGRLTTSVVTTSGEVLNSDSVEW